MRKLDGRFDQKISPFGRNNTWTIVTTVIINQPRPQLGKWARSTSGHKPAYVMEFRYGRNGQCLLDWKLKLKTAVNALDRNRFATESIQAKAAAE